MIKFSTRIFLLLVITFFSQDTIQADTSDAAEMDWPHWRGPEMNGVSRETGLIEKWSPKGKNLLWKRENLGSRSTPIVMNGKLYTICRDQPETKFEGEKVVCVDAATGETIWENRWNVFLSDVPDTRVGWSSVCGDPTTGNVFALGVCGYFQCIDGKTGKTIWSRSLSEEYGLLSTYGGRTNFPIIIDNQVIISAIVIGWGKMAKPAHRFISFDKRNGIPVWFESTRILPYDTTYSSPIDTVLNGQRAIVFGSGDGGVHAFQPRTGKNIWTYNVSRRGINTSPLVVDDHVYIGHGEENVGSSKMGAFFAIDGSLKGDISKTGTLWKHEEWYVGKSTPLMVDGKLIVVEDNANLVVVDPATGKELSHKKLGTMMRSSPLYADGKIYTCTANGRWYTLKLDGNKVKILHRMRLNGEESYGSPIVSHGRIYVPTTAALYCIGDKNQKPSAEPRPKPLKEASDPRDLQPVHLQLVPVECLLKPGQKQKFSARIYNRRGQFLSELDPEDVKYEIKGQGTIGKTGIYSSSEKMTKPDAVIVTATYGANKIQGSSRIRVVPGLPWKIDFSDGKVPVTWVGARYRSVVIDEALFQKLTQKEVQSGQLYIYLMSSFINSGRPQLAFNNKTPRQTWNSMTRYLRLTDKIDTVEKAKAFLEPSLKNLAEEKVIESWKWEGEKYSDVSLMIKRGSRKIDGNGVMVKITTIPKGTRSQSWMGHVDFHDYTIQADVMGHIKDGKVPDIGLIGARYTFDMMGASQQLQIRTWPPQLRMAKTVPFQWKPNVWYTMKFKTAIKDGKAILKGKVWPRFQKEPDQWMVEAVDEIPSLSGSPGLFGNAKDAEVFYDNIAVYSNK